MLLEDEEKEKAAKHQAKVDKFMSETQTPTVKRNNIESETCECWQ